MLFRVICEFVLKVNRVHYAMPSSDVRQVIKITLIIRASLFI